MKIAKIAYKPNQFTVAQVNFFSLTEDIWGGGGGGN